MKSARVEPALVKSLPVEAGESVVESAAVEAAKSVVETAAVETSAPVPAAAPAMGSEGDIRLAECGNAQQSGCDSSQSPSYSGPGSKFA